MTVTLTQTPDAALPDRPRADDAPATSSLGLAIDLQPGDDGATLLVQPSTPTPTACLRLATNRADLRHGSVAALRLLDAEHASIAQLRVEPAGDQPGLRLILHDTTNAELTADLDDAFAWHTLELRLGQGGSGDAVELWVDGRRRDATSAALPPLAKVELGGMLKVHAAAGRLRLDELAIADAPLGPVPVEPISPYPDDPARWLVIYNAASADSATWAERYRTARGVPYANLLGLDLPTDETIDAKAYELLRQTIEDHLDAAMLRDRIAGVLLGYRVPGMAQLVPGRPPEPIAELLTLVNTPGRAPTPHPLPMARRDPLGERPTAAEYRAAGLRLTARIDGPTLGHANAMIDHADDLIRRPIRPDAGGQLCLDLNLAPTPLGQTPAAAALWADWIDSPHPGRLRLPIHATESAEPGADSPTVHNDAIAVSWRSPTPPAGYFADPPGRRGLMLSLCPDAPPPITLRNAAAVGWIPAAFRAGYAAVAAAPNPAWASALPRPQPLFEALRRGWTLAEAWAIATPRRPAALHLVGDPLLRLTLPRDGFDVLGPIDQLHRLDPNRPEARLPVTARRFTLPPHADADSSDGRPPEPQRYAVVRRDHYGRAVNARPSVTLLPGAVAAQPAPLLPLWPDHPGWATPPVPRAEPNASASITLRADWGRPLRHTRVAALQLQTLDTNRRLTTIDVPIDPANTTAEHAPPAPTQTTQYRWIVVTANGAESPGPWSAPLAPPTPRTRRLTSV